MVVQDRQHLSALTSLRFFAAIHVCVFHSGHGFLQGMNVLPVPIDNLLRNGYVGVSFFFVLSGFILTYVYAGGLQYGGTLQNYSIARVARILPVYWLSLLIFIVGIGSVGALGIGSLAQFFLLQSWTPYAVPLLPNWNFPAWSLSVEFFFYLTFPVILAVMSRIERGGLLMALCVLALLMLIGRLPPSTSTTEPAFAFLYYVPLPLMRLPEFVFGVVLGVMHRREFLADYRINLGLSIGVTIVLLCASVSLWVTSVMPVMFGLIIVAAVQSRTGVFRRILEMPLLILLGGASYALYILQSPVRGVVGLWTDSGAKLIGQLAYYPTLLTVSILVFLWFEEPVRRRLLGRAPGRG